MTEDPKESAEGAQEGEHAPEVVAVPPVEPVHPDLLPQNAAASAEELEATQRQLDEIRAEVNISPLVGDKIPFETVAMEYDRDTSPEFYNKALELASTYECIRQIRKDGNCFYRAFLVAQTEIMMNNPDEKARFISVCKGWKDRLLALGFCELTTSDFCDTFYDFLDTLVDGTRTWANVFEQVFLDDNNANYLIIFFRLIASGYVKENSDNYAPFIDGNRSINDFCITEIEQMWVDVDHLAISAFVGATGTPIRIEYMDRGAAPNGGWHYEFPQDKNEQAFPPKIVLLYRPGHYDIIYPHSS